MPRNAVKEATDRCIEARCWPERANDAEKEAKRRLENAKFTLQDAVNVATGKVVRR
jgi:hypothetical protein